jgi:DNA-binding response OmpR family regulator
MAHILIVDDFQGATRLMGRVLEIDNHTHVGFTRGEDVLSSLEQAYADLVIVDLNMPHMDGFTLCEYIRNTSPQNDIPIVVVTASHSNADRFAAYEAGADAFMTKPYGKDELLQTVNSLLQLTPVDDTW